MASRTNDNGVIPSTMARMPMAQREQFTSEGPLGELDCQILAFERQWWKFPGAKEQGIRDSFGLSAVKYYQVLNSLLDRPEALAQDPLLIKRLRRLRTQRQQARSARRIGEPSAG